MIIHSVVGLGVLVHQTIFFVRGVVVLQATKAGLEGSSGDILSTPFNTCVGLLGCYIAIGPLEGVATRDGGETSATKCSCYSNWKPSRAKTSSRHSYLCNIVMNTGRLSTM